MPVPALACAVAFFIFFSSTAASQDISAHMRTCRVHLVLAAILTLAVIL